jgi:hypothetical protein
MCGQLHVLAALPPGSQTRHPLCRSLCGPSDPFVTLREKLNLLSLRGIKHVFFGVTASSYSEDRGVVLFRNLAAQLPEHSVWT